MMKPLVNTILILLLFTSACYSFAIDSTKTKSERVKFDPNADPEKELAEAVNKATTENKRILLDIGGEWCIWCHRLDEFIEQDEEIKSFLHSNFVVLKINYSKENKNEKFLSKFPKIPGYPHFFVLSKKGELFHSQDTGVLESDKGYSKEKFMAFLKEWAPKKIRNRIILKRSKSKILL